MSAGSGSFRQPGRPRSDRIQEAILDATLELLRETGFSGLAIESVASRAGVGKATIYHRWTSKVPLVIEAMQRIPEIPTPALVQPIVDAVIRGLGGVVERKP